MFILSPTQFITLLHPLELILLGPQPPAEIEEIYFMPKKMETMSQIKVNQERGTVQPETPLHTTALLTSGKQGFSLGILLDKRRAPLLKPW